MPRPGFGSKGKRGAAGQKRRFGPPFRRKARKKLSRFQTDPTFEVDYRDPASLRPFLTETGKVLPRRISGNSLKQQREVSLAIKRARVLALLPYPGQDSRFS